MERQRKIKVSKIDKGEGAKVKKVNTILRWPWWLRIRVYKKIATMMLADEIGFVRAQTLSLQKVIDLSISDMLGLPIVIEPENPISESDETAFMWTTSKDLHQKALEHVLLKKSEGESKASLNLLTQEAVIKYLEKM